LLSGLPAGLTNPVAITDVYVSETRLRLRRMECEADVIYKLGQKVRSPRSTSEVVNLTNMYLSAEEYAVLAQLGGAEVRKTRWNNLFENRPMAIDQFHGHLEGLFLAEVELGGDEPRFGLPPFAAADVTDDDRFSGGHLADATSDDVKELLATISAP
jgi:CYTH domain-containing protein